MAMRVQSGTITSRRPNSGGQETVSTRTRILDVAERLVQVRGFNGFSYADVAAELGITKAALHYHFASKSALGAALIDRYGARLSQNLARISSADRSAVARLRGYAALYRDLLPQ